MNIVRNFEQNFADAIQLISHTFICIREQNHFHASVKVHYPATHSNDYNEFLMVALFKSQSAAAVSK